VIVTNVNFDGQVLGRLIALAMEIGKINLKVMEILDKRQYRRIWHTKTSRRSADHRKKGPFIVISDHDLHGLQMPLEQTGGKGGHSAIKVAAALADAFSRYIED
jgi:hydroxylamine reductase (hybrid-cluster protein)